MDKRRYNSNQPFSGTNSYQRNNFSSPFQSQSRSRLNSYNTRNIWSTNNSSNDNGGIPSLFASYTNSTPQNSYWLPNQPSNPAWLNTNQNWSSNNDQLSWGAPPRLNFQSNTRNRPRNWGRGPVRSTGRGTGRGTAKGTGKGSGKGTGGGGGNAKKTSKPQTQTNTQKTSNFWTRKRSAAKRPASNSTNQSPASKKSKTNQAQKKERNLDASDGILVAIVDKRFPLKKISLEDLDKFITAFNTEKAKFDSSGNLVKGTQKKKGCLYVACKDQDTVEKVKNIVTELTPWEGIELKSIMPVEKNVQKWIVIVPSGFPSNWFDLEQIKSIEESLEAKLNSIPEGSFYPELTDYYKRRGSMLVACGNDESVEWLNTTVAQLNTPEGDQPQTMDASLLPIYCKIEFLLPSIPLDQVESLISRLNRQNEGLETKNWYIIRKTEAEGGIKLIASIERKTYQRLKEEYKMKLFLNFGTIEAKYLGTLKGPYNNKKAENETEAADAAK